MRLGQWVVLIAFVLVVAGCTKDEPAPAKDPEKAKALAVEKALSNVGKSPAEVAAAGGGTGGFVHPISPKAPPVARNLNGVVLETMDAAGYTYVRLKTGNDENWLAGPATQVSVGDYVRSPQGAVMKDFASLTLKRTFPEIIFVESMTVAKPGPGGAAPTWPQSVVTFNTGLARNYVPFVEERLPAIIKALNSLDAQVVCLQEVWEERDVDAITKGVKQNFPHSFRLDSADSIFARDASAPSCSASQLDPLGKCVTEKCATAPDKTGCVMKECGSHFLTLPGRCRTCLAANVSKELPEILATCTSKGVSMSYDGGNGLVLLSRESFADTNHIFFDSFLMQRVALHGTLPVSGGLLNVFCTHLTTPIAEVDYAGKYATWEAEQSAQVDQLIAFVLEKAGQHPAILLGDLNLGPTNVKNSVEAEFPEHFARFDKAGFASPYTQNEGLCTFCGIAPLGASGPGKIIDHVLFLNLAGATLNPKRILDGEIVLGDGRIPLSDHYGIQVDFTLPSTP